MTAQFGAAGSGHRLRGWVHGWPLRWRLVAGAVLAVVLALAACVGVAYVAVSHELIGQVDSQLSQEAAQLQAEVRQQVAVGEPQVRLHLRAGETQSQVQVISAVNGADGNWPVSPVDYQVAADKHTAVYEDLNVSGTPFRALTVPVAVPGYAVQIAIPTSAVDGQLHRLSLAFWGLGLVGVVLAAFLAWLVARRALSPVGELTRTAEEIATTLNLAQRISDQRGDELGRLATSFNRMLDALARSVNAQRQLVADASHELRTPLASLRTNVEVLRRVDELPTEMREEVISAIVGQLEELTALVTDVMELARGEETPEHFEEVDFDVLVGHAVARSRRNWPAVTFRLWTQPVAVRGVANRLDRAVNNLLDNAAKFSPPGAAVEVSLTSDGTLAVRDHGPGVPEEALPHVFDRFYRADEARSLPGSGLGLAIVKQVAERHGGRVSIANVPGGGAVSLLRVPPVATAEPAPVEIEVPAST
ncbi:MAG: sensor histidine kinase [Mycobacteriales bacterium]